MRRTRSASCTELSGRRGFRHDGRESLGRCALCGRLDRCLRAGVRTAAHGEAELLEVRRRELRAAKREPCVRTERHRSEWEVRRFGRLS